MKLLLRNSYHVDSKSHDISVYVTTNKTKVKMTYESGNAYERFNGEVWDGYKWNNLFTLMDLKQSPNSSFYIHPFPERMNRCNDLIEKGLQFIKIVLT